ncbi:MAG: TetR/AcrR family transcriptional regulator [Planctomycetota bacterium]|jgi:AcrR family transcriptional regulator
MDNPSPSIPPHQPADTTSPQVDQTQDVDAPASPASNLAATASVPIKIDLQPLRHGEATAPKPANRPGARFLSRDQILQATVECFAEKGYDGATIRAIAGRLGCAVGSIYRYFKDKHKLLLACAEGVIDPLVEALADPAETVEVSMQRYRQQAQAYRELYHLLFWLASIDGDGATGLPRPIEDLINAWGQRLDGRDQAERLWIDLHGQIIFGRAGDHPVDIPAPDANRLEMVGLASAPASEAPKAPAHGAIEDPTAPEITVTVDAAQAEAASDEDVTLL